MGNEYPHHSSQHRRYWELLSGAASRQKQREGSSERDERDDLQRRKSAERLKFAVVVVVVTVVVVVVVVLAVVLDVVVVVVAVAVVRQFTQCLCALWEERGERREVNGWSGSATPNPKVTAPLPAPAPLNPLHYFLTERTPRQRDLHKSHFELQCPPNRMSTTLNSNTIYSKCFISSKKFFSGSRKIKNTGIIKSNYFLLKLSI